MRLARLLTPLAAAALAAALGAAPLAASPSGKIKLKQREAEVVLAQVSALDSQLGKTVEEWDGAQYDLAKVRKQLATNRASLVVAQRAQHHAEQLVQARLVTMYESNQPTTIDVVLGSTSLGDLIDRLQAARSVATSDRQLAEQATQVRDRLATVQHALHKTEHQRAASVQQLTSQKAQIGAMLAQRRRLLASVQTEIATMRAAEAKRQAELAAEARKRLAAEQAELRKQAADRERAAEAAAAAANAAPPPATTTTAAPPPATTASTTTTPVTTTTPLPVTTDPITTAVGGETDPVATTTTDTPPVALPAGHPEAATIALRYLGVPYVWGGESPKGFDCSGLVAYVYAQLGITLPHYAAAQYQLGVAVPRDQLQPGDLVFFDALDHVGIYIGGGQFVHAPHTGDVVKITTLASYGDSYVGARRI
ncbi:MAG TPA: NlpC/P60 family protein [Gaiellaceae bacterium]|nr:NlpC/P60 family protein [Gaiellaceae bacterium]